MRGLLLMFVGFSVCLAQSLPPTPILVGAGFSDPFPLTVAPGQLLTLFVQPPAAYYTTEPMPSIGAVFWNGSDEAMPILQVQPTTAGCSVPASSGVCPNLLALTVQVPFDAPINPAVGSNIVVRPSGIAVFVSGEKSSYFGAQVLSDQVHIFTMCDVLVAGASPAQGNNGLPCAPMITHADGTSRFGERSRCGRRGIGGVRNRPGTNQSSSDHGPARGREAAQPSRRSPWISTTAPNALRQPGRCPALALPLFSGRHQGYVGLYQINFIVPPTPAGLQPCAYSGVTPDLVNGIFSNLTVSVGSIFSFDGAGICVMPSGSS